MRFRSAMAVAAAVLMWGAVGARAANEPHPSEAANRVSIGIDRIDQRGNNVDRLYWYERTGAGVSIYVVDTGVNFLNNDFGGRVVPLFDFQRQPGDPNFGVPNDEHGTDVASQAGGRTFGVAKNATIYSVRVKDFVTGAGSTQNLVDGLDAVLQHVNNASGKRLPAVVNMSILQEDCSTNPTTQAQCNSIESKVNQLVAAGVVVVAGTNNSGKSSNNTAPCRLAMQSVTNGVICVAGTDAADDGFSFNDSLTLGSGTPFEILAPAGRAGGPSTWWLQHGLSHDLVYGKGGFLNGNSAAAPLVAGAVALYLENFAGLPLANQPLPGSVELAVLSNASPIFSGSMVYTGCDFLPPYSENPILDNARFVKQNYHDFFGRQPDTSGWNFWIGEINNDPNCANDRWGCFGRTNTSRAFFESIENRETNFFAYRLHRMTFSLFPKPEDPGGFSTRTNPRMERLFAEGRKIGRGVVVGAPNWNVILENNQRAFVNAWVASTEFTTLYPGNMSNAAFVQALYDNAQVPLDAVGTAAIQRLQTELRGPVVYDIVTGLAMSTNNHLTHPDTVRNLWNPMYVLLCYMGYLRRNPDDAPNFNDLGGFNFWLDKLNDQTFAGGNPELARHEMIRAFITSPEYGERFFKGPHCGQPAPPAEEPPIDGPGDWGGCGNGMIC
jgi:Subtilase family/Domain of unknown function (DUF4214)